MITLKDVSKTYRGGTITALNQVNLNIEEGALVALVGRNGAGKSTMFKIICGIITDYLGECMVNGKKSSMKYSRNICYLPEVRGLDGKMTVLEHLTDLVCYKGIKKSEAQEAIRYWLREFEFESAENRRIETFSKGNQQKLQFIATISCNPQMLILDEPFSGLDTITTDIFWKVIDKIHKTGCTIILSTHILNDSLSLCDQYIFLVNGCIREFGTLPEIQDRFEKVLEIKCSSMDMDFLCQYVPEKAIFSVGDEYYVQIEEETKAKEIYYALRQKYCEKFYYRKITITELFRKLNGEAKIYE
jgi:ABC-2 type transport system ATP-binding protein